MLNLKLASRPLEKLRVGAEYKYDERDNDTPRATYDYVVADSADALAARSNLPYGFRQNLVRLNAGYELPKRTDLSLGFDHDSDSVENARVAQALLCKVDHLR